MSDADVLREESELRQCLEALLQNAGVLNTNRNSICTALKYLSQAMFMY